MAPIANFKLRMCLAHAKTAISLTNKISGKPLMGEMIKGTRKFPRGLEEWLDPPETWRTMMCGNISRGMPCKFGHTCAFAHTTQDLRHKSDPMPNLVFIPKMGEPMETPVIEPEPKADSKPHTRAVKPETEAPVVALHTNSNAVEDCGICSDSVADAVLVPCGHKMCQECVQRWRGNTVMQKTAGTPCPFCRVVVSRVDNLGAPKVTAWAKPDAARQSSSEWQEVKSKAQAAQEKLDLRLALQQQVPPPAPMSPKKKDQAHPASHIQQFPHHPHHQLYQQQQLQKQQQQHAAARSPPPAAPLPKPAQSSQPAGSNGNLKLPPKPSAPPGFRASEEEGSWMRSLETPIPSSYAPLPPVTSQLSHLFAPQPAKQQSVLELSPKPVLEFSPKPAQNSLFGSSGDYDDDADKQMVASIIGSADFGSFSLEEDKKVKAREAKLALLVQAEQKSRLQLSSSNARENQSLYDFEVNLLREEEARRRKQEMADEALARKLFEEEQLSLARASVPPPPKTPSTGFWSCQVCTFDNQISFERCAMCMCQRP